MFLKHIASALAVVSVAACLTLSAGCGGPTPPEEPPEEGRIQPPEHIGEPPAANDDSNDN